MHSLKHNSFYFSNWVGKFMAADVQSKRPTEIVPIISSPTPQGI